MTTIEYFRVLPRDLFNEAKLLKCLGRLILMIEDYKLPASLSYEHEGEAFDICLSECGNLFVSNLQIFIADQHVVFCSTYNSKANYPLLAMVNDEEITVFHEDGEPTAEFLAICK